MTYILDSLNSEDGTARVEQLEAELESVRNAFEEYVSTTEGLEVDVKKELREMQSKMNSSSTANQDLAKKLRTMESLFKTLELSSEVNREKLKSETKLRRQAERAMTETELELRSKIVKIRQLERSDSSALRMVDSGIVTEMMNNTSKGFTDRELEAVTDELIATQEKLTKAEEQLKMSQTLVQDLERNLQNIDIEAESLSGDDKELLRELDEIRAEIDAARSDVQSQSTGTEQSKEKTMQFESQLETSREENLRLIDEIACLRNLLHDQGATRNKVDEKVQNTGGGTISTVSTQKIVDEVKEVHQFEIKSLRKQIEKILDENMALQEMVQKLEIFNSSHQRNEVLQEGFEVTEDEIIGVRFTNDLSDYAEDSAIDEKLKKTEMMLQKSLVECSGMRFEILALSESLYNANLSRGEAMVSNKEIINLTGLKRQDFELLRAQNEVEDKKREIIALKNNLMSTQEEARLFSEEILYMSSTFEKAQDKYNFVIEELQQTESALAAAKDTRFSQETELKKLESVAEKTPEMNAEIQVLKTQFKKLNEKNENLARQVKDAESEVSLVREKQDQANAKIEARAMITKELQDGIEQVVNETNQRNREVEELAVIMENRMNTTERNVEVLDCEIAVAMRTLQTTQVASLDEKLKPPVSLVLRKGDVSTDGQSVEIDPETNGTEDEEKAASVDINARQSTLEQSRRLIEKVQKLTSLSKHSRSYREGQLNEDDRTASLSTNSMYSDKKKNKFEDIIQKVAKYESLTLRSKEKRQLEASVDVGIEERE